MHLDHAMLGILQTSGKIVVSRVPLQVIHYSLLSIVVCLARLACRYFFRVHDGLYIIMYINDRAQRSFSLPRWSRIWRDER